jgi:hypothetical protein
VKWEPREPRRTSTIGPWRARDACPRGSGSGTRRRAPRATATPASACRRTRRPFPSASAASECERPSYRWPTRRRGARAASSREPTDCSAFPGTHEADGTAFGRKNLLLKLIARHGKLIKELQRLSAHDPLIREFAAPAIAINVELRDVVAYRTSKLGSVGWQINAYCALGKERQFILDDLKASTEIARSAKGLGVAGLAPKQVESAPTIALLDGYVNCQSAIGAVASRPVRSKSTLDLEAQAYRRLLIATERDRVTTGRAAPAWSAFLRLVRDGDRIFTLVDGGGLHPSSAELAKLRRLAPGYTAAGRASDAAVARLRGTP